MFDQARATELAGVKARCPECGGRGFSEYEAKVIFGRVGTVNHPCPTCKGTGKVERLREALWFYAKDENYGLGLVAIDRGQKARAALGGEADGH